MSQKTLNQWHRDPEVCVVHLMVLSEVSSTRWGSSVSLGYQAAWRSFTDAELVKKRSATGIVLTERGNTASRVSTDLEWCKKVYLYYYKQ